MYTVHAGPEWWDVTLKFYCSVLKYYLSTVTIRNCEIDDFKNQVITKDNRVITLKSPISMRHG